MLQKHASDAISSNPWLSENYFDIKIETTMAYLKDWVYEHESKIPKTKSVINYQPLSLVRNCKSFAPKD